MFTKRFISNRQKMYFVLIPISATTTAPTTALSSTPSSNPSASDILPSNGPCANISCTDSPKRNRSHPNLFIVNKNNRLYFYTANINIIFAVLIRMSYGQGDSENYYQRRSGRYYFC